LSDFGVLDDDMSDSQRPNGGPGPYDGWDLDGLLSGENVTLPEGMRPVARTLDALRVAPMRAELAAEEAARTAFRQIMLSGGTGQAWPVAGTDDSRTLVLASRAADGGPRPASGPHRHRRPPRRAPWQAKALVGAAAAVVIVGATVLVSTLSGAGGHPGQSVHSAAAASATSASSRAGSPGLEGSGAKEPTAKPTATAAQQSGTGAGAGSEPGALCRQYFASFMHQEPAKHQLFQQLSTLAGGSANVVNYCLDVLQPWSALPQEPGNYPGVAGPGPLSPGDSPGSSGVNQSPGHGGNGNVGAGNAGSGNAGSANSQGRNSPAFGKP
jgi:hypothetical protein